MAEEDADSRMLDLIQLTAVPGVGPQTCRSLLGRFGSAGAALAASQSALATVSGVGPKLARKITQARSEFDAAAEAGSSAGNSACPSWRKATRNTPPRSRTLPIRPCCCM